VLRPEALFISDLHLSQDKPATTQRFLQFLRTRAAGVERLYILGDLFDAWIGDDDPTPPTLAVKTGIRALVDAGTTVYFQHGNRDFLIGERFVRETGVTLLEDYAVIDLNGTPTLVMHGDLLCTDDIPYQTARARVRTDEWKRAALAKPLFIRQLYARWYRLRSRFHKRNKSFAIMDVNPDAVIETMRKYEVTRLIHGHTHRPYVHDLAVDGKPAQRLVLAEWTDQINALSWSRQGAVWLDSV
jgi:UDP-2,3-diacylglucosamine hydrolase